MTPTIEKMYEDAMYLSDEMKARLAERLVEYLETNMNPSLERTHIKIVKRRRDEIRKGLVKPIEGETALNRARQALE